MNIIHEMMQELNRLDETHFSRNNLERHYDQHVATDYYDYFMDETDELFDPISPEEYDMDADSLSKEPVKTSAVNSSDDVIGYVTIGGRIVKYRKSTGELVVYKATKDDAATISYYKASSPNSYLRKIKRDYGREIFPEDDYYNR